MVAWRSQLDNALHGSTQDERVKALIQAGLGSRCIDASKNKAILVLIGRRSVTIGELHHYLEVPGSDFALHTLRFFESTDEARG